MVSNKQRKTPQPKIFTQESIETPKHDEMLILFSKDSDLLMEIIDYVLEKDNKFFGEKDEFEIQEWEPEKAIVNNNYYIGSIDLYVRFEKKNSGGFGRGCNFIFEFKPQIKSFSEVLRQVKVYEEYFSGAKSIVITYSDVEKFKECFENQNISLIQLDKYGKFKNEKRK